MLLRLLLLLLLGIVVMAEILHWKIIREERTADNISQSRFSLHLKKRLIIFGLTKFILLRPKSLFCSGPKTKFVLLRPKSLFCNRIIYIATILIQ